MASVLLHGCFSSEELDRASSPDNQLARAIATGKAYELNSRSPEIEKNLLLRLLEFPAQDGKDCLMEISGVCQYSYFLTVSSFDEAPIFAVFPLEIAGKIIDFKWLQCDRLDCARLTIYFDTYSTEATANNPDLKNMHQEFDIHVNIDQEVASARIDAPRNADGVQGHAPSRRLRSIH